MIRRLLTYSMFGNRYAAVEHCSIGKEEQLNSLVLRKKNAEFVIESSFQTNNMESLIEEFPKQQHVFLVINTDKVIFKALDEVADEKKLLASAFPNLKIDDFYYEIIKTKERSFIAICRKDAVHSLVDVYKKKQLNVVGFSLGPLVVFQLEGLVDKTKISTSNSFIYLKDNFISNIRLAEVPSMESIINGLKINNNSILPLAGILTYFGNHTKTITNFSSIGTQLIINFRQQRIFNFGLKICLATIFTLLLLSFLLFTNYSTKINELTSKLALNKSEKNIILSLSEKVEKKEKLIQEVSMASSKASWYIDQVGITIPNSVLLTEIQWQPIIGSIKEDKVISTSERTIIIKGESNNAIDFSEWMTTLEQLDWVETIAVNNYGADQNANIFFEFQVTYKL